MEISGGCHCGNVRFTARTLPSPELLDCNCSICRRTGYLHLIIPRADFTLESGAGMLASYRFGSGLAEHLFCRHCGIKSFYQPRSHPAAYSINFNCLDPDHGLNPSIAAFDGQNWDSARQRIS